MLVYIIIIYIIETCELEMNALMLKLKEVKVSHDSDPPPDCLNCLSVPLVLFRRASVSIDASLHDFTGEITYSPSYNRPILS